MTAPLLEAATIGKTHGYDGFLRIYSLSGETEHLRKLKRCTVRTAEGEELKLDVELVIEKSDLLLMKFSGYPTPEKARLLVRSTILIERENAEKLKEGEYYVADLYNMDVLVDGKKVAVVEYTMDGAQSLLLSARRNDNGKSYLIPLLDVFVTDVSPENNTLTLLRKELIDL